MALLGVGLLLISPFLSASGGHWWAALDRQSVSIFAILVTVFYGNVRGRKSRVEALALAEAARSRNETEELRAAMAITA